jgi:Coenzyme PQQ synthesis protein D (PqqD)
MPSLRLRSGSVAWRAFQGEGTLVHLERDEIHSMNATATLLIERLKTGATVEDLCAALCKEFEVDPETARRDAVAFIEQLRATESVEDIDSDAAKPEGGNG